MKIVYKLICTGAITFINDEDVSNFHYTCLHRLNLVTCLWHKYHKRCIGKSGYFDFALANPNRFYNNIVKSRLFQQVCYLYDFRVKSSQCTSCCQRPNKYIGMVVPLAHSNTVA